MEQNPSNLFDQIRAVANLGDWYLIFGQVGSATKAYKLADDLIKMSDTPESIKKQVFGSGQLINFEDHKIQEYSDNQTPMNLIQVSMTISRSGSALDIEVKNEENSLSKKEEQVLRKYFKQKRFRPSFENGKTQSMQVIVPYNIPRSEA